MTIDSFSMVTIDALFHPICRRRFLVSFDGKGDLSTVTFAMFGTVRVLHTVVIDGAIGALA